jgi:hypothetical protein
MSASISGPTLPALFPNQTLRNRACTPLFQILTSHGNPSMDYMLSLPSTRRGNDSILVVVDRFSKMAIMVACKKNITVEATAKIFFE